MSCAGEAPVADRSPRRGTRRHPLAGDHERAWYPHHGVVSTSHDQLRAQVGAARNAGYAISSEEYEPGVFAIAVPVRNARGEVLAAMSVLVDPVRYTERELTDRMLPALRACEVEARALLT